MVEQERKEQQEIIDNGQDHLMKNCWRRRNCKNRASRIGARETINS